MNNGMSAFVPKRMLRDITGCPRIIERSSHSSAHAIYANLSACHLT